MYHYIEYVQDKGDTIRQSLDILPHTFEKQLETLLNAGYTPMTMAELGEVFDEKRILPVKPIVLTFDDGYRDFYTDAYPIMKKYHVKGTQYVISGYVGYKNYMTKEEIEEIAKDGLVEIGAHTAHHVSLKFAPLEEIQKEVKQSKEELEMLTQKPIVSFAYPNGSYDDRAIATIKEFGFTTGVGTKSGIELTLDTRYALVRIRPGSNTDGDLLRRLNHKVY